MSPRITARHLLLIAAAALLSACSSPLAPADSALRTDTRPQSLCSGVYGGVGTRECSDTTGTTIMRSSTTTESTSLSGCSGVYGGVGTRCDEEEGSTPIGG